jgi:hypothetical protein
MAVDSAEKLEAGTSKYGGVDGIKRAEKQKVTIAMLLSCLVQPMLVFLITFYAMSFSIRYSSSIIAYVVVALMLLATLRIGSMANQEKKRADSLWLGLIFLLSLVGWFWAALRGNTNFNVYMQPFYQLQQLNVYQSVDPSTSRGNQYMDYGILEFVPTASVDKNFAMAFKNGRTYCAAPVTVAGSSPESYDFWAVGSNCCTSKNDFNCVPETGALSGLRELRDSDRSFYELVVKQAAATYGITVNYPAFFEMVSTPSNQIEEFQVGGYRTLISDAFSFLCIEVAGIVLGVFTFTKL